MDGWWMSGGLVDLDDLDDLDDGWPMTKDAA
jgi:hypothetical protein